MDISLYNYLIIICILCLSTFSYTDILPARLLLNVCNGPAEYLFTIVPIKADSKPLNRFSSIVVRIFQLMSYNIEDALSGSGILFFSIYRVIVNQSMK